MAFTKKQSTQSKWAKFYKKAPVPKIVEKGSWFKKWWVQKFWPKVKPWIPKVPERELIKKLKPTIKQMKFSKDKMRFEKYTK